MESADRIAERWRSDRRLAALIQTVVPVAGLLAEGARTLRQAEFDAVVALAGADEALVDELLISVDRFAGSSAPVGAESEVRARLLERIGLYGCHLAVELIRSGQAPTAQALSSAQLARSGFEALRRELGERSRGERGC